MLSHIIPSTVVFVNRGIKPCRRIIPCYHLQIWLARTSMMSRRGLYKIFASLEYFFRIISRKKQHFLSRKYLYKKSTSPDPGISEKRDLGRYYSIQRKFTPEIQGFFWISEANGVWRRKKLAQTPPENFNPIFPLFP